MGARRLFAATLAATAIGLALAAPAQASFHEMSIREVYPGGADEASYVELQMWAAGQEFVSGHHLVAYNANGSVAEDFKFAANVSGGANQSTVLVADSGYGGVFAGRPAPDASDANLDLSPAGGAVCWVEGSPPDCVAWGNFTGPLPAHAPALVVGSPAAPAGVPAGMALRRTIAPGCSTLLELGDDSNDSAVDFADVFPAPRPNSATPSEHACGGQLPGGGYEAGGQQGGGAGSGRRRPQTRIVRKPRRRTRDRTPTFRFASTVKRSTYLCKLDRRRFKRCPARFTTPKLRPGRHVLRVKARAPGGAVDKTPAIYRFRVIRSR